MLRRRACCAGATAPPRSVVRLGERRVSAAAGGGVTQTDAWGGPPPAAARDGGRVAGAAPATRTFWVHAVTPVAPAEVKRRYAFERAADKRSRFSVRNRLREDGALSNLYPIRVAARGPDAAPLYVYEMYVTRRTQPPAPAPPAPAAKKTRGRKSRDDKKAAAPLPPAAAPAPAPVIKRVSPSRSWQAIQRYMRQRHTDLPPMVQLEYKVFAAAPLPTAALQVPAEYRDLGWQSCELRLLGRYTYADIPPSHLQQLVNKIVPWSLQEGAAHGSTEFSVVREKTGKLICTSHGIASGGLRIFRGVLAQALFIDAENASAPSRTASGAPDAGTAPPSPPEPLPAADGGPGLSLAALPQGTVSGPVRCLIESFVRTITYKGKKVESYYVADSSGKFLLSYWEPTHEPRALEVGRVYDIASFKVKDYPSRGNLRLFELTEGTVQVALQPLPATPASAAAAPPPPPGSPRAAAAAEPAAGLFADEPPPRADFSGTLALKIDTKGTIASETSLWEDVRQHFGDGPYDEETERRIAASVQGTAVVSSYDLRQSVVRLVRCRVTPPTAGSDWEAHTEQQQQQQRGAAPPDAPRRPFTISHRTLSPALVDLLPQLDPHQPWAVLPDYTTLPLQVLHCCFDPSMKGWQDIAVSSLSLMPEKRMELLTRFQQALAGGLRSWGLHLADAPLHSPSVSLLPMPQKDFGGTPQRSFARGSRAPLRHPPPSPYPTTLLVVGITGARGTGEQSSRVSLTAQQMSAYFKTSLVECVASEADAVRSIMERLLVSTGDGAAPSQRLRDPNAAAIIITPERESRAARWVTAECLCRGVLPLLLPPAASARKMTLLCSAARRQLLGKCETNPLRGMDLARNVPALAGQRVLVVGVDSCHTNVVSTGALVGILHAPERNHLLPVFWRHEARGRETQHVSDHFRTVLAQAAALYDGLDQVIVFQDGDVFSELNAMKSVVAAVVPDCGLTFMCLHKRSNIRFIHDASSSSSSSSSSTSGAGKYSNLVKGNVIPALTPVPLDYELAAPSFYLQTHETNMSTARTVVYTVHHVSPTLDVADVQQLANAMANVMAPQATKLPMSTRCAHKLADKAERLLDAVPQLTCEAIPSQLMERLWFL